MDPEYTRNVATKPYTVVPIWDSVNNNEARDPIDYYYYYFFSLTVDSINGAVYPMELTVSFWGSNRSDQSKPGAQFVVIINFFFLFFQFEQTIIII